MHQRVRRPGVATVILLTVAFTFWATAVAGAPAAVVRPDQTPNAPRLTLSRLPLAFEPNVGQAPDTVRFVSQAAGHRLWLEAQEARFAARGDSGTEAIRLRWIGGAASPAVVAEDLLPGKAHYYTGPDRSQWRENVPMYGRVLYRGVYPGIDLVFHGTQQDAEFDFVVQPGADPRSIRLEVTGADAVALEADDLVARRGNARLRLHRPAVYQEGPNGRVPVDGRFRVTDRRIAFEVGAYDRTRALVIDPVLSYSTYFGDTSTFNGVDIGVDSSLNMYVALNNRVVKLSADGATLLYSTTIGDATPVAMVTDSAGTAYVGSACPYSLQGRTPNCPFTTALAPGHPMFQGDQMILVSKLTSSGTLSVSATIGGNGSPQLTGIAAGPGGTVYITGWTPFTGLEETRPPFGPPGATGGQPAFVQAITADLSAYIYAVTFRTSSGSSGFKPAAIAVDSSGAAYVTGQMAGTDFPTTPGAFQPTTNGDTTGAAVVAKITPDASALAYATYFGTHFVAPRAITVDASGNAYLAGFATQGLPTANAMQATPAGGADAFVAKLNAAGSALGFSTYLGGSLDDAAVGIALDSAGNIYVAGSTDSTNFPQQSALDPAFGTAGSNFVAALNPAGNAFLYSTYFGDTNTFVGGMTAAAGGSVFLTGSTSSASYPTVRPYQASLAGGSSNAFIARIDPSAGAACPTGQFFAEYFSNMTLTAPATRTACETTINNNYGAGGPSGLPVDNFSVRWTGRFQFGGGSVTFTATADDGVRVFLDGVAIIDQFHDQPATTYTSTQNVSAGEHEVKVEYYEKTGDAVIQVSWTSPTAPTLMSLAPSSTAAGGPAFTLTATGTNFTSGSQLYFGGDGVPRTTTFVSATRLDALIQQADIATAGVMPVIVRNPDGQFSNQLTFTVKPAGGSCATGQYFAEYFSNMTLTPPATRTACEGAPLSYNWGAGGPAGLPVDNFSARWTGRFTFAAGTYDFTATADDGVRVFLDDVPIIDQWHDQGATTYTATRTVTAGDHEVRVEYYEHGGAAVVQASWSATGVPAPSITTLTPSTATAGGPAFTLTVDGAAFVSGAKVFWNGHAEVTTFVSPTRLTAAVTTDDIKTAGTFPVFVVNADGQRSNIVNFTVNPAGGGCPAGQFTASYFSNATLTPPATRTACETAVNYDWGTGGPAGLPVDNFSARWVGTFNFAGGNVTFTARADDGIRVFLDGTAVIDQWHDQAATTYTATVNVAAGAHEVKIEYYEHGGAAVAQVSWTGSGPVGPTLSTLTPNSATAGDPAFTLTADGSNFVSGATVLWNGAARTTTFVSATRLTASIPASDIAAAGSVPVTVRNPDGQTSGAQTFTINPAGCTGCTFTVAITSPANGATVRGTIWFTVWVEGAAAGNKVYTLTVNGATITSTTTTSNGPVSLPWTTSAADNGSRTATVTVRDSANATGTASVTLTVAN
jgi:hypothetical protein